MQGLIAQLRSPSQTIIGPPGTSAFYPTMAPMEHSDVPPQAHAANALHLAQLGMHHVPPMYTQPITDTQVAHARLNKQGHRPLGRTQSAPLPLGHPMLTGAVNMSIGQTHYENSDAERQAYEQQHLILTQKIRQTVLTRSGRVDSLKEEEAVEVIDLTDKAQPPKPVSANSVISSVISSVTSPLQHALSEERTRDQEYLQKQRELLISMQVWFIDMFDKTRN